MVKAGDKGAFARAVIAEYAHDLAAFRLEAYIPEYLALTVGEG